MRGTDKPTINSVATAWVRWVARHAGPVLILAILTSGIALHYAVNHLGVNTDTADMIARDLDWRQTYIDYKRRFPLFNDNLTLVIDAGAPEAAESAARNLATRLQRETGLIEWLYAPALDSFFSTNGLLYLDEPALVDMTDRLAQMQPLLARLMRRPELAQLLETLSEARGQETEISLDNALQAMTAAIESFLDGRDAPLSWRRLMSGESGEVGARQILVVHPRVDYSDLLPAQPAIERIREIAAEAGFSPEQNLRLRITGGLAMSTEEMQSVSRGMGTAGVAALVLVALVLFLGLRHWSLVAASLVTLISGLCLTAAFAAIAVGHLNLISVAFAVLYIGLGIDYAAHYSLRYRELISQGAQPIDALSTAAGDVGVSLVLCALTTGVGFLSFVPTEFAGLSELGLISGTGMFISLIVSLTVLPAWLALMPVKRVARNPPRSFARMFAGHWILAAAAVAAVVSLPFAAEVRFDRDPVNLRERESESVATYRDLSMDGGRSTVSLSVVVENDQQAQSLKTRLKALPLVHSSESLTDFVPENQEEKLFLIEELELTVGPLDGVASSAKAADVAATHKVLADYLNQSGGGSGAAEKAFIAVLHRLSAHWTRENAYAEAELGALNESLFRYLPMQIRRLGQAMDAQPIEVAGLPVDLRARWIGVNGGQRVEVYANTDLSEPQNLLAFVNQVRTVAPDATDSPVINLESGNAVVRAFKQAFLSALVLVGLLLFFLFRRANDVALVLAPLILAGIWTLAAMVVLGIPFNFANVITLPLLLGIGVDNGIHMVHRFRQAPGQATALLSTSTARAMVLSALTTLASFGNLAYSDHPGTAGMGQVLSIGLLFTLFATLAVLPAWLARKNPPRQTTPPTPL